MVWIEALVAHVRNRLEQGVSYLHWVANTVFKLDVLARRVLLPVKVTAYLVLFLRLPLLNMKFARGLPNRCWDG